MADSRPLGMLDSGVGGLSVLLPVRQLLPTESIIYVADEGHMPYGPRPRDEIRSFVEHIAVGLRSQGCKALVIACNAANAAALHYLREAFPDWPIIGMEPAIKPAVEHTRTGIIGVLTTKVTYQGELFASVMDRFAANVHVITQISPDFVLLVEQGMPNTPETRRLIAENLEPFKAAGIDQLVLACTHFPFLTPYMRDYLGPRVTIVDPAPAVARQLQRVLTKHDLLAPPDNPATVTYFTSGDPIHFAELLTKLGIAR